MSSKLSVSLSLVALSLASSVADAHQQTSFSSFVAFEASMW